jgi:hypothetical protein
VWISVLVNKVDPVFAIQCHRPDGVLGGVGAQLQDRMIQKRVNRFQKVKAYVDGNGEVGLPKSRLVLSRPLMRDQGIRLALLVQ